MYHWRRHIFTIFISIKAFTDRQANLRQPLSMKCRKVPLEWSRRRRVPYVRCAGIKNKRRTIKMKYSFFFFLSFFISHVISHLNSKDAVGFEYECLISDLNAEGMWGIYPYLLLVRTLRRRREGGLGDETSETFFSFFGSSYFFSSSSSFSSSLPFFQDGGRPYRDMRRGRGRKSSWEIGCCYKVFRISDKWPKLINSCCQIGERWVRLWRRCCQITNSICMILVHIPSYNLIISRKLFPV